jgi:hypothetical protein
MSSQFTPGLQISRQYYKEVIEPIIQADFPDLTYSAALIGPGSEVLGFDTPVSTDHDWRPRTFIFLNASDFSQYGMALEKSIREKQAETFQYFSTASDNDSDLRSRFVYSVEGFAREYLAVNLDQDISYADWLTFDEHRLLGFTSGEIFHEGLEALKTAREKLSYYPSDVWLYLMASQWGKISEEEAFIGRTGDVGDEIGPRMITSRIVHLLMRLCFYLEKQYIPYSKWFGTGFHKLKCASILNPLIASVLAASTWKAREKVLAPLFAAIVGMHNELALTPSISGQMQSYYERPYLVLGTDKIAQALTDQIADPTLKTLPLIGSLNQLSDTVQFIENTRLREKAKQLYF